MHSHDTDPLRHRTVSAGANGASNRWIELWRRSRTEGTKPLIRQAAEIAWLRLTRGFSVGEYYAYDLASRECDLDDTLDYASNRWHWKKQLPALNDRTWVFLVRNKLAFHRHFSSAGLRTPAIFGVYHPRFGLTDAGDPLRSTEDLVRLATNQPDDRFVLKPVSGRGGDGILSLDRDAEGGLWLSGPGGRDRFPEEASGLDAVVSRTAAAGLIVQEYVAPHPALRRICPSSSGTVRIVTLRDPDGEVGLVAATLRLGRTGSLVDNFGQGGVSISVDLPSGRLGRGICPPALRCEWITAHPDTGVRFEGETLPDWDQVLRLCRRAARGTPGLAAVGWDVLISPYGPVLLEGNDSWDLVGMQIMGGGYLRPAIESCLAAWGVEVPDPAPGLPAFRPRPAAGEAA